MKKLYFLFLLAGGLLTAGCTINTAGDDGQEGMAGETLTVTASPSAGGSVARSPDQTQYGFGAIVALTANPASGYVFSRWEGDATGSANPTRITMNGEKTATAVFTAAAPPLIRLSASSHTFLATGGEGGPYSVDSPFLVDITNEVPGTLSGLTCSFPDGAPSWLTATLSGSTAPATLTVTVAPTHLGYLGRWKSSVSTRIAITSAAAHNSPQYIAICVSWREHASR